MPSNGGFQNVGFQPSFEFSATGGAGNFNLPATSYFGLRQPGTFNERLGVLSASENTTVTTVGGKIAIDFANTLKLLPGLAGGSRLEVAYNHMSGDRSQNFSTLDPRGDVLLIPGTGDPHAPFSAGVALGSGVPPGTPGGFNRVEDIRYQRDFRSDTVSLFYEQFLHRTGPVAFSALAGLNVSRNKIDEFVSFSLPGFSSRGDYNTNLDFLAFSPAFGGGVYVAVGDLTGAGRAQTIVYGRGAVGPVFTRVDGTDRLNMNGFINTNQAVDLSGNHTGFYGSFTGGVRVTAGDFFGDGSVTYVTSDSFGNVIRTGQTGETSRVNFERGDSAVFKFTFGMQFRGGVRVAAGDVNR